MTKEDFISNLDSKFRDVFKHGYILFNPLPEESPWRIEISRLGKNVKGNDMYYRIIVDVRYYGQYVKKYELNYPQGYTRFLYNIGTWVYNRINKDS